MGRLAFTLAALLGVAGALHAQASDPALEQFLQQYEDAYNKGDVRALADLHTEDVLRLGSDGRALAGRSAIEQDVAAALNGPRKGSRASIQPGRTQFLKPDVALVDGTYEVTGGTAPVRGRYLITLLRDGSQWRIASIATVSGPADANR